MQKKEKAEEEQIGVCTSKFQKSLNLYKTFQMQN